MYSCRNLPTFQKNLLPLTSFLYSEHEDSSFFQSRQFCTRPHGLNPRIQYFIVTAVWGSHISQVNLQDGNTFRSSIKLSLIYTMAATRIYFHKLKQLHEINTTFDCTCLQFRWVRTIICMRKWLSFYTYSLQLDGIPKRKLYMFENK